MRIGASYYPELLPRCEWERDLKTGRDLGLSVLRCGEFWWPSPVFSPGSWSLNWVHEFLELACFLDYEVIWCTPSAAPPPEVFERWSDAHAVNVQGHVMPVGVRRQVCPSHKGFRDLSVEVAARLADELSAHLGVVGWQVDNEIAGDGFTCWCERCRTAFHGWLEERYGTLEALNAAWQTGVWSQYYTQWTQVPLPRAPFGNHAPSLKLAFARFKSDNWLHFYRAQADALRQNGARRVTTNFFNLSWDVPFDGWAWRPHLDALGLSHYLEKDIESRFELALLRGAQVDGRPLWVLEQKAGQQRAQNLFPDDLGRIEKHLRRCAEAGAQYAIYWHLRQHAAGCEQEHGAVLSHDGRPGRIARAIKCAISEVANVASQERESKNLLLWSYQNEWATRLRPQAGAPLNYRHEVEHAWYGGALDALGSVQVGEIAEARADHKWILAPLLCLEDQHLWDALERALHGGATVVTTADLARLDSENNVRREPPLSALQRFGCAVSVEVLHLHPETQVTTSCDEETGTGSVFWALPDAPTGRGVGTIRSEMSTSDFPQGACSNERSCGPLALCWPVGAGTLVVVLTAPDRITVASLLRFLKNENRALSIAAQNGHG